MKASISGGGAASLRASDPPAETVEPWGSAAGASGLSSGEAARLLAARPSARKTRSSRSYWSIVRSNVFTVFNAILAFFGGVTLAFGSWQDALFLGILVANTLIGIVQEVRAKRALDRLSALVVPTATVLRDGDPRRLPQDEVVEGDLVVLQPGDQLIADGQLRSSEGLLLDESNLSGDLVLSSDMFLPGGGALAQPSGTQGKE